MDNKVIKVTDPTDSKEQYFEVYEDLDYAIKRIDKLSGQVERGEIEPLSEQDKEYNILHKYGSYQVLLTRERHQTDKPLSDFQRNFLGQKFNWDERAVTYDKGNIIAQDMFYKLKFISTGKKQKPIDPEELLSLQDYVNSQADELKKNREQDLDYIQNKEKDEKNYTKSEIQTMMDNAIDNEDYKELDRIRTNPNFSWFFKDDDQLSEEIKRIKSLMKKIIL